MQSVKFWGVADVKVAYWEELIVKYYPDQCKLFMYCYYTDLIVYMCITYVVKFSINKFKSMIKY